MNICEQATLAISRDLCNLHPFWLGSGVGLVCSVLGAVVEYRRARQRSRAGEEARGLPGCMVMVTGALGFAGIISLGVSLFSGQLRRSLWMGAGVGSGFAAGFVLLMGLWWALLRRRGS